MKAKLFNDYIEYIYFMEQDMNLKRYQSQDEIAHHYRILHYKSDILLSLLLDIDNRKPISFDTFAAFFDWDFIEQALLNFPASSRFQIFEILLKTYIDTLQNIDEDTFLWAYKMTNLDAVLQNTVTLVTDEESKRELSKRQNELPLLKTLFTKQGFGFQEAKKTLVSLGVNEHFAHFFLEYLQTKYQKKKAKAPKFVDYYFTGSPSFIYLVQNNPECAQKLEAMYFAPTLKYVFNEEESTQLHYEILRLLEGFYGESFIGYYEGLYEEMKYVSIDDKTIFQVLIRALFNDLVYLKRNDKLHGDFKIFDTLEKELQQNYSLQKPGNMADENIISLFEQLHFPKAFLPTFMSYLKKSYQLFMGVQEEKIPVYKKEEPKIAVIQSPPLVVDPFLERDSQETKAKEALLTLFNEEEKGKYLRTLEYLNDDNSAIAGYRAQLEEEIATLMEIAMELLDHPEEKSFYVEMSQLEMEKITDILFQIEMVRTLQKYPKR